MPILLLIFGANLQGFFGKKSSAMNFKNAYLPFIQSAKFTNVHESYVTPVKNMSPKFNLVNFFFFFL